MTDTIVLSSATHQPTPVHAAMVTTTDGSQISGVISGLTDHTWTADGNGLFHTATDLKAEWTSLYTRMLDGHGDQLTAEQRMEGNAESVIENTAASKLSAAKQVMLREDLQREYDAIGAAMKLNATAYGIDPTREFSSYSYLKMEETLQSNETLQELGIQGHGLNDPTHAKYDGYTTDFQNRTDNKTFFVGGGSDNGEKAIADFLDDVVLTHVPFVSVMRNGVMIQLNQNGNDEDTVATSVAAINEAAFTRVFVASDFSLDKTAHGAEIFVPNAKAAAADPVAATGQVKTLDGSVISGTISTTEHTWVADSTGLFHTKTDLTAEWKALYKEALQGVKLNPLQLWEANAEAVAENTGVAKLSAAKQEAFREDAQREFDAVWAAMKIDQTTLGISATAQFTSHTYLKMEETLRFDESLEALAVQGHGLNGKVPTAYRGFTENFQNHTDNKTLYVGGGLDNGEKAIADFFDDVIITHASFPTVLHNGKLIQLDQNADREDSLTNVVKGVNEIMFTRLLTAADFKA